MVESTEQRASSAYCPPSYVSNGYESNRASNRAASVQQRQSARIRLKCATLNGVATGFCSCGIIGIAAGGGLLLIYALTVYTNMFGELTNPDALSIPGFCLLFAGMVAVVIGIILCWVYPKRRSRNRRANRHLEDEAGFGLPGHSVSPGYYNHGLVLDLPPAYADIASASNSARNSVPGSGSNSSYALSQLPPKYTDATKEKNRSIKVISGAATAQSNADEQAPPIYQEVDLAYDAEDV